MSAGSQQIRPLSDDEIALLARMVKGLSNESTLLAFIRGAMVSDMDDGGMRSLRFHVESDKRRRKRAIRTATFRDLDGVLVSLELSVDEDDIPFELDVWKVDFSALKRLPKPEELCISKSTS
jgi:uncharacterized protein DUF6984